MKFSLLKQVIKLPPFKIMQRIINLFNSEKKEVRELKLENKDTMQDRTKRPFMIGAAYEYSFTDFKTFFEELGIKLLEISYSSCYVVVDLPEKYGLLHMQWNADNCPQCKNIKKQLEEINPGYELLQVIFEVSDNKVVLVTFSGTEGNSNIVCFKPEETILIKNPLLKLFNTSNNPPSKSHEFI